MTFLLLDKLPADRGKLIQIKGIALGTERRQISLDLQGDNAMNPGPDDHRYGQRQDIRITTVGFPHVEAELVFSLDPGKRLNIQLPGQAQPFDYADQGTQ